MGHYHLQSNGRATSRGPPVSAEKVEVPGQEVEGLLAALLIPAEVVFHQGDQAVIDAHTLTGVQHDLPAFGKLFEDPAPQQVTFSGANIHMPQLKSTETALHGCECILIPQPIQVVSFPG